MQRVAAMHRSIDSEPDLPITYKEPKGYGHSDGLSLRGTEKMSLSTNIVGLINLSSLSMT